MVWITTITRVVNLQTALCWKNTVHVYVMFRRAKRHVHVVMVRLHTLSSWLPKHKGFARRYAHEPCYGFRVTSEVISSILFKMMSPHRLFSESTGLPKEMNTVTELNIVNSIFLPLLRACTSKEVEVWEGDKKRQTVHCSLGTNTKPQVVLYVVFTIFTTFVPKVVST